MGDLAEYLTQHDANFRQYGSLSACHVENDTHWYSLRSRLPSLYSDFRPQRTLNPDGYRANVSAWRQALARLASNGHLSQVGANSSVFVLDLDSSLLRSLEDKRYGQPLALGTIIREAVSDRDLVPLEGFLTTPQNIYQRSWTELPWKVMSWTLQQLGVIDPARGEDVLPRGRYVVLRNLEAAAQQLVGDVTYKPSRFDRIFTRAQFQQTKASNIFGGQPISETDLDVLLRFLSRDKGLIAYDGRTIRIKGIGEGSEISEEDSAIASIKALSVSLKHQINLLNVRLDELDQTARAAVAHKSRVSAIAALKSKKITETSLSKRHASLNQLEEVAAKIEQASDNVELVKVMASSIDAIKSLNAQVGDADNVDGVIGRLREEMSATDEVAAVLAESATGMVVDEDEIDQELEEMERVETEKEENAQRKKKEEEESREAAAVQKKLDDLPHVLTEEAPSRDEARTPTSETGIANLSIEDKEEPARRKVTLPST